MVNDDLCPGAPRHDDAFVLAGIADVARRHLEWTAPISRELRLVEAFQLDSLRHLTLVIELENRFRIRLDDQEESAIVTVGDLVDMIRRKLQAEGAGAGDGASQGRDR
jgi:acyl carrier protein